MYYVHHHHGHLLSHLTLPPSISLSLHLTLPWKQRRRRLPRFTPSLSLLGAPPLRQARLVQRPPTAAPSPSSPQPTLAPACQCIDHYPSKHSSPAPHPNTYTTTTPHPARSSTHTPRRPLLPQQLDPVHPSHKATILARSIKHTSRKHPTPRALLP